MLSNKSTKWLINISSSSQIIHKKIKFCDVVWTKSCWISYTPRLTYFKIKKKKVTPRHHHTIFSSTQWRVRDVCITVYVCNQKAFKSRALVLHTWTNNDNILYVAEELAVYVIKSLEIDKTSRGVWVLPVKWKDPYFLPV